jgi:hypothetical protein
MPEGRLQRTREAYRVDAFRHVAYGWCDRCFGLHSSLDLCLERPTFMEVEPLGREPGDPATPHGDPTCG